MGIISTLRHLYHERLAGRRRVSHSASALPPAVLSSLRTHGYAIVPGFLSATDCAAFRAQIDRLADSEAASELRNKIAGQPKLGWPVEAGYRIWTDATGSDFRIIHAEKLDAGIASYYDQSALLGTGSLFLGRQLTGKYCMANRTRFVPGNAGSGGGWHRDDVYRRGFKALAYLVDVDDNNGPFQLVENTQTWGFHLQHKTSEEQYQYTAEFVEEIAQSDPGRLKTLTARAGDLVLFETNLIHRGKPVVSGARYALPNDYAFA